MKAFTFVELLLVITIIAILLALTIPLGISFYKKQQLDVTTEGVIQALRRAQLKAASQADYSFGVYLGSGQTGRYVLFRGDSYGTHDDEEIFDISPNISFSGLSEVVFSRLSGISSVTGDIILTSNSDTEAININEIGRISYTLPPGCWGIDGYCDSGCQYSNYGDLTNYYTTDPGCASSCSVAGSFYTSPGGACSNDGLGSCYKMEDSLSASTTCDQGDGCEEGCAGTCTPCEQIPWWRCTRQRGCDLGGGWPPPCEGICDPCDIFNKPSECPRQDGCDWTDVKWWWNLDSPQTGYLTTATCRWYQP